MSDISEQKPSNTIGELKKVFTESFIGFRLDLYGFYIVILPLGIWRALMKYHIKPLGRTRTQGFRKYLYGYDLFLYS